MCGLPALLLACSGGSADDAGAGGQAGAGAMGAAAGSAGSAATAGAGGTGGGAGVAGGGAGGTAGGAGAAGAGAVGGAASSGTFSVLTYNVAGLPQGISGGNPIVNTPLISPKLNAFDLVYVQEDFTYHTQLISAVTHSFKSTPLSTGGALGDGLNRLARYQFSGFTRTAWTACYGTFDSGSDCLTKKGFSVGLHHFANGVWVDVYNLHMDAGHKNKEDYAARAAQTQQLLAAIAKRSAGMPVIVVGDTNMKDAEDEIELEKLLTGAGLTDVCRALSCPEPERIDRILFRGNASLKLTPKNWRVDQSFVDGGGKPLSDHEAVAADFDWAGSAE